MTDIYPIKGFVIFGNFWPNLILSLIFIILSVVLYFIIFKEAKKQEIKREKQTKSFNIKEQLQNLLNQLDKLDTNTFYAKLDKILRKYLKQTFHINLQSLTYNELIQSNIDSFRKEIIKQIYFKEFSNIQDTPETRRNLLKKLINFDPRV